MVTAVSPSSFDYEETISTLKYADRAKRYVRYSVDKEAAGCVTNKQFVRLHFSGFSVVHYLIL